MDPIPANLNNGPSLIGRIENRARVFFENARGSHGWDHVERVLALCRKLGPKEGCDMTILEAAALLHDIGREEADRQNGLFCHASHGAKAARGILREEGLDETIIEAIVHCIESHRFREGREPASIEAKILYDADKLDSLGAVGVGRAFQFAGEVGARLHDPDVDPATTRAYGPDDTAYREYLVKLRHLKDKMLTRSGRALAEERSVFMDQFFTRLNDEAAGRL